MAIRKAKQGELVYLDLKHRPDAARALLASILAALEEGRPIDGQARDYLTNAIEKILRSVPPARALYLTGRQGRMSTPVRDARIYYRVLALVRDGRTQGAAFTRIAGEETTRGKRPLTGKAIEKIFLKQRKFFEIEVPELAAYLLKSRE